MVDQIRVVHGSNVIFLDGAATLVHGTLTRKLPSSVPLARYDEPRLPDMYTSVAQLLDVLELLRRSQVRWWNLLDRAVRRRESHRTLIILSLDQHVRIDI